MIRDRKIRLRAAPVNESKRFINLNDVLVILPRCPSRIASKSGPRKGRAPEYGIQLGVL
ncbi:protein of unknown function [Shinella sp. WSC3-e]|nr:hypothetical protein SHINE37_42191 [Rhizobiaceae bacterium]CAK7256783.1 protein of unknown function [Shinella sp. WSC3-e]